MTVSPCPVCGEHGGFHDFEKNERSLHSLARDRIPVEKIIPPRSQMKKWEKVADDRESELESSRTREL